MRRIVAPATPPARIYRHNEEPYEKVALERRVNFRGDAGRALGPNPILSLSHYPTF